MITENRMALIGPVERRACIGLLRQMPAFAAGRIMKAGVGTRTGAAKGSRRAMRQLQRNGYRHSDQDMRTGRIALRTPQPGMTACLSSLPEARRTVKMAWPALIRVACVHGVPTRPVDDPVKAMGAGGMSRSQVSRLCPDIGEGANTVLSRPPAGAWPCLWLDAPDVKMREGGRIVGHAAMIAVAVNEDGMRKVPGVASGPTGAGTFRTEFPRPLADRGLRGVMLMIAGGHKGLRAAARRVFNATRQRCRIHWIRNAPAHAPARRPAASAVVARHAAGPDGGAGNNRQATPPPLRAIAFGVSVLTYVNIHGTMGRF